jgi:hypothetical protein
LRLHYRRQFGPLTVGQRKHKDIVIDAREILSGLELEDGQTQGNSLKIRQYKMTYLFASSMVYRNSTAAWKNGSYNHGAIGGDE